MKRSRAAARRRFRALRAEWTHAAVSAWCIHNAAIASALGLLRA